MRSLHLPSPPAPFAHGLRVTLPGVALFGGLLMGLPLTPYTMGQMQALNQELGKLCSKPPRQAINVCRIHARLVDTL